MSTQPAQQRPMDAVLVRPEATQKHADGARGIT
jgi:hypothetical protein